MTDRSPFAKIVSALLAPLLLVLGAIAMLAVHVPQHKSLSPSDEYVYIDYLAKVPEHGFVHRGEKTGPFARHYLDCHGVSNAVAPNPQACASGATAPDGRYPFGGDSTADIYSPVYFAVSWALGAPLRWLGVDLVDSVRWLGAVWLALAGVLLYVALVRIGAARLLAFALGLALIGSPSAFVGDTFVSTDAPTYAVASALLLALVSIETRWAPPVLIVVAAVGTLTKLQNFASVAIVAFVLLAMAGREAVGERSFREFMSDRRTLTGLSMLVAGVLMQLGWLIVRAFATVGPVTGQGNTTPLTKSALVTEFFRFFGMGGNGPERLSGEIAVLVGSGLLMWIWVGGVIGTAASAPSGSLPAWLAIASFVVAIAMGPLLALASLVFTGAYIPLTARYGMAMLPAALGCAAYLFSRKRWISYAASGAGVIVFAAGLAIAG